MPSYYEAQAGMMGQLLPMLQGQRRLDDAQQEHEFNRRLHMQNLQRQYDMMRQQEALKQSQIGLQGQTVQRGNLMLENTIRHQGITERLAQEAADNAARGRLKPGYKWNTQDPTQQDLVPGGPAWYEQADKHSKDKAALGQVESAAQFATERINRILDPKNRGGFEGNFGGYNAKYVTQHLPIDSIQGAKKEIESLQAYAKNLGLGELRSMSGAIGSITEREWPIIGAQIEALDPMMPEKDAEAALRRIKTRVAMMRARVGEGYKGEWQGSPFYKPSVPGPAQQGATRQTATGPNGEKVELVNGQWQPATQ